MPERVSFWKVSHRARRNASRRTKSNVPSALLLASASVISGPETGNTCPFSQAVHPGKRSRWELPVCGIRDTASCHRSGDRPPFFRTRKGSRGEPGWLDLRTQLGNQSSSSHAAQRLSPFGHRCEEEPSGGQLWRHATRLWVHEESEPTRRKPLTQRQVGSSRRIRKASRDEIHGGAVRRAHTQALKKKILVLDIKLLTREF